MSARDFRPGDTAAMVIRYGRGLEKLRHGHVVAIGAAGVQVRFDDTRETLWLRASQLRLMAPQPEVPASKPAPPALALVPAAPPATAPATARTVEQPTPSVAALEAAGVDPVAAWLSLGRELIGRASRDVEHAEAAVTAADREVADARALLASTEAAAATARDRLRDAVNRRAEIERRTGAA